MLQSRPPSSGNLAIIITRHTVFRGHAVQPGDEFDQVTPQEWIMIKHRAEIRPLPTVAAPPPPPPPARETESATAEPPREAAVIEHKPAPRRRARS